MKVIININLKEGVLDPQGQAVEASLGRLGFTDALNIRMGKSITMDIDAPDAERARQRAARMCENLLANTVIEDYSLEVIEP